MNCSHLLWRPAPLSITASYTSPFGTTTRWQMMSAWVDYASTWQTLRRRQRYVLVSTPSRAYKYVLSNSGDLHAYRKGISGITYIHLLGSNKLYVLSTSAHQRKRRIQNQPPLQVTTLFGKSIRTLPFSVHLIRMKACSILPSRASKETRCLLLAH